MGPIWGRQDPGVPHVGLMNFAIWGHVSSEFKVWLKFYFSNCCAVCNIILYCSTIYCKSLCFLLRHMMKWNRHQTPLFRWLWWLILHFASPQWEQLFRFKCCFICYKMSCNLSLQIRGNLMWANLSFYYKEQPYHQSRELMFYTIWITGDALLWV